MASSRLMIMTALAIVVTAAIALTLVIRNGDQAGTESRGESGQRAVGEGGLTDWTLFGRVEERTHFLPAELNPPLQHSWQLDEDVLIEFPPALDDGRLYVADKYGRVRAIRGSDGKVLWTRSTSARSFGPPSDVTGPLYAGGALYFALFNGQVVSLDARTGDLRWRTQIRSRLESSPIEVGGKLYMGTDRGEIVVLDPDGGKVLRSVKVSEAPVRASPSFSDGLLYAADYAGNVIALRPSDMRQAWRTDTTQVGPGGKGGFYSSPAIGFGRVYIGRDDGTVWALDAETGRYEWAYETHHFVYGSPAVADVSGSPPPAVYIGSYDGRLYSLDAETGKVLWQHSVGGPVPGTATVIGDTVYTSSFRTRKTIGIDVASRKQTFEYDSAGYTPMVSDGQRLYLAGYSSLHAFVPKDEGDGD